MIEHDLPRHALSRGRAHAVCTARSVEVPAIDPAWRPVLADDHLRVYLSDESVLTAAPGALVRFELIVAWNDAALDHVMIRGTVDEVIATRSRCGRTDADRAGSSAAPCCSARRIARQRRRDARDRARWLAGGARARRHARGHPRRRGDLARCRAHRRSRHADGGRAPARLAARAAGRAARHDAVPHRDPLAARRARAARTARRWAAAASARQRKASDARALPPAIRSAELTVIRRLFATCPPAAGDGATASRASAASSTSCGAWAI